ncbi:NADH-quinone oxidoreductase subunit M [Hippea alviniae]|uniref:NADH-quinone oxidoreductase subunit M n=1 Tax=Hippea alviniae TaxID=1279027 RepID=UPI0003B6D5F9|nr:NADH-quinone oxidoreductase subunit M [Hippea alviniae]
MNELHFPILTTITFLPLVGAFIVALINEKNENLIRYVTFGFLVLDFFVSLPLLFYFNPSTWHMQFVERVPWIKSLGFQYYVGVDGISLWLVLLTTFLTPLAQLSTWKAIDKKVKLFNITILLMQTGMLGVFISLDMFLFYVFWEVQLIPMYLMIGIWGGPNRVFATMKFFLYTFAGSVLMMVAIMALYFLHHHFTGTYTTDIVKLMETPLPHHLQLWLFLAFFLAFAIKVPMWPFHTWLPWAHVEAPTAGSVILAGILLKMGTYGFLRFNLPMFPDMSHAFAVLVIILAIIGIFYGAFVAMVQPDIKKLVAYSSVSHLGYSMLGMFALTQTGLEGSILQMINHGISTGALFLLVGIVYERRHTRLISEYGGLAYLVPVFAVFFMIFTLSSIAVPGTNGFIGEFMILLGAFLRHPIYGIIVAFGGLFSAVYMLTMYKRVFFNKVTNPKNLGLPDMTIREWLYLVPLLVFVFWIGIYPRTFLSKMRVSVEHLLKQVNRTTVSVNVSAHQEASLIKTVVIKKG